MEAHLHLRRSVWMLAIAIGLFLSSSAGAANFRTENFLIQAATPDLAQAVGEAAERYRHDLAVHWLGEEIAPWPTPCPIRVVAGNLAAQGVTTYNRAPVRDFQMEVVGTPERILDSVLPHEVSHTVLATHFGRPLPRWADEGICTTVEHDSERQKHEQKLREFLASRRGIAMNRMFLLTEYPNDVLPLYAQGYSVCRFLIEQRGPQAFIAFLQGYMDRPSWTENVREHYGYESLAQLQEYWLAWVASGSGAVQLFAKVDTSRPGAAPAEGDAPTVEDAQPASRVALAAASDQGSWYNRKRQDTAAASVAQQPKLGGATQELLATPVPQRDPAIQRDAMTVPPSVRNLGWYSAAQPRPEQSFSAPADRRGHAWR